MAESRERLYSPRLVITFPRRTFATMTLGTVLLFASACESSRSGASSSVAGSASPTSAAADNTAGICKSGGEAARDAVMGMLSKMAGLAKSDDAPSEAEVVSLYKSTFGRLRDSFNSSAAQATNPEFTAVLKQIAAESDKIVTSADPESVGMDGFQAALTKLETFCPSGKPKTIAAPGDVAGAKGSGCELPVTFAVADKWQVDDIVVEKDDPLAELMRRGPLEMTCEVNAKRLGIVGFLRVWIGGSAIGGVRPALQALISGQKTRGAVYTPVKIGGQDGMELQYQLYSNLMEEYSARKAFAVVTPGGVVVVELSGLESDDPAAAAAYEQAKTTLTIGAK